MIENFKNRYSDGLENMLNISKIMSEGNLTSTEISRLSEIREAWNFYEGYHWEGMDDLDSPQITFNYCRSFVNKFVAFEFGKGINIHTPVELDDVPVTIGDTIVVTTSDINDDGDVSIDEVNSPKKQIIREKTLNEYLCQVWKNNKRDILLTELGQTKSITGEAWIKVQFQEAGEIEDIFEEYPNGRIKLSVFPTQYVFPEFDNHDKDKMTGLLIMYPIRKRVETGLLFKRTSEETIIYKEYWTKDSITIYEGKEQIDEMVNPYGFIPFVQIKNFPVAGRTRGVGDIDDIIPLNVELNTKKSDVSEVIDYHSAPITLVYGAKIGNLEKGANKVWGGLPKDSKVENLSLSGDLIASQNYIKETKTAMCEIAGIPETVLGGASAISNTSGVALQYMNLPLIERTNIKRAATAEGLQRVNKMIIYISYIEGLINKPDEMSIKDFISNEVEMPDTLPKDVLIELQMIQQEMTLGLECRHGALKRIGVDDIARKIDEVDRERLLHPEIFNSALQASWYTNNFQSPTNAGGMMNGQTPKEQVNIEKTGQNGGAEE